jgi:hypothetical protein
VSLIVPSSYWPLYVSPIKEKLPLHDNFSFRKKLDPRLTVVSVVFSVPPSSEERQLAPCSADSPFFPAFPVGPNLAQRELKAPKLDQGEQAPSNNSLRPKPSGDFLSFRA